MQIAICDDEKTFINELVDLLVDYKKQHCVCIDIFEFSSGEDLINSNDVFDMIFLDFQMKGINGLETAKILRAKNITCSIVFVTNYPDFVFDSFEVNPYRFFKKPISFDKLNILLNKFIAEQKLLAPLIVINDSERYIIESKNILYLEGDGKNCKIVTNTKTYKSSKTLSHVHELLPSHCFYRIHKSFVINLYSVKCFDNKFVTLTNNDTIDISRNKSAEFKKIFTDFVKNFYLRT